jgi:hypothetical protein
MTSTYLTPAACKSFPRVDFPLDSGPYPALPDSVRENGDQAVRDIPGRGDGDRAGRVSAAMAIGGVVKR